jgi:hypothetical protein
MTKVAADPKRGSSARSETSGEESVDELMPNEPPVAAWFDEVVKPNLPPDLPAPTFAPLHYSNTRK